MPFDHRLSKRDIPLLNSYVRLPERHDVTRLHFPFAWIRKLYSFTSGKKGRISVLRKKDDVSSVSPSSERSEELWVVCEFIYRKWSYAIGGLWYLLFTRRKSSHIGGGSSNVIGDISNPLSGNSSVFLSRAHERSSFTKYFIKFSYWGIVRCHNNVNIGRWLRCFSCCWSYELSEI